MGGEAKVTVMVLKVDLGCKKCYRKIKKVLCSTPQIRDQLFDEKSNTVTITVICCSPENVQNRISKKAGGTIKGIEIKKPPPPADKPKDGPVQSPPPQQKQGPPPAEKPKSAPPKNGGGGDDEKPKAPPQKIADGGGGGGGNVVKPKKVDFAPMGPPQQQGPSKTNQPAPFMSPESIPVSGYPSIFPPVLYYDGGPYYQNQGMATMAAPQRFPHSHQPVYQYDGYTGRPVGDVYRSDYNFSEENPSICSVM